MFDVLARDHPPHVEEQSLRVLQDVRLVDERHLLAAVLLRVVERVPDDALRAGARDERDRLGGRARVAADLDVVLVADVQPFRVLADQDDVDVVVAAALRDRVRGPHVGVELERLAQRDVDRAEALADRRLERTLQRDAGALDRVERLVGNRIAVARHAGHAGVLCVPFDVRARCLEEAHGRAADRRTDPVSGDQRDWCGHVVG